MPALSIASSHIEDALFCLLAVSLLIGAFYSVVCREPINSVFSFFLTSIILAAIIILFSNTAIGIIITLVYTSLCSVLLLINTIERERSEKKNMKKSFVFIWTTLVLFSAALCYKLKLATVNQKSSKAGFDLIGVAAILIVIFLITLSGVCFLVSKKSSKN